MQRFTGGSHGAVRLAAAAALLVVVAGCTSDKGSGGPPPPPAYGISGRVSGVVSAGVTITVSSPAGTRRVRTAGDGRYFVGGLYDGTYAIEPSLEGHAFNPPTRTVTLRGADATGQDFTSVAGIAISGTVSGDVKEGVTVTLRGPEPLESTRTATTDANGSYQFWNVTSGSYRVTPSLGGGWTFAPANTLVTVAGLSLTGANFTAIAPTHALSGRIRGPVASGVVVTLSGDADAVVVADGAGDFTFAGLRPGSYVVTPSHPGAVFTPAQRAATVGAADVSVEDFASAATHAISGQVSGDVRADVQLSLSGAATATARTDASGAFAFDDLVDGIYTVTPARNGFTFAPAARSVTVSGANAAGVTFTATAVPAPAYRVSGSVYGAVRGGVTITLQGATTAVATTDDAGAFTFAGVAPGTYLLIPLHDDYTFDPASSLVVVSTADVDARPFAATLDPTARTISGNVTGAATTGVTVTLVGPSPSTATRTTTTDGLGDFAFRGLTEGLYLVTPTLGGFRFTPADCLVDVAGPSVTYVPFVSERAPHSISGAISPATAGVTVNLTGTATATTTTGAGGTYAFTDLADGPYKVKPELAGYAFTPVEASLVLDGADVTSVDFAIAPTHRISGHLSGDVLLGVRVTLAGAAAGDTTTDATGYYEFVDLRDGRYVLTPSLEGYAFDPLYLPTVLAGTDITTADFAATLDPTYSVSGTISGAVAADVTVELRGPSLSRTVTTNVGGVYLFTGLPNGSYMVIPSLAGYGFTPASRAFRIDRANVAGQDFTSVVAP